MTCYLAVLKNYAGFRGRARRREYWMFVLVNALIGSALVVFCAADGAAGDNRYGPDPKARGPRPGRPGPGD